jgi:hypothetical protein
VKKHDIRVFLGHLQDVGIKIPERGREDEFGTVQLDHAFHGILDIDGFGDSLFLDHLDPRHFAYGSRADGVGLVVPIVVFGTNVNEADRHRAVTRFRFRRDRSGVSAAGQGKRQEGQAAHRA